MSRLASLFLVTAVSGLVSCKPRVPASALRSDEPSTGAVDPQVMAEAAKVRGACEGNAASFFRGVGSDGRIDYLTTPEAPSGDGPGVPTFYEEARFANGRWSLSEPIHGRPGASECLRAVTTMTTQELTAALGCVRDVGCVPEPELCSGGACLASLGDASFASPARAAEQGALALADPGADADGSATRQTEGVRCQKAGDGSGVWLLMAPAGSQLGRPLDSEANCWALVETTQAGVTCAWTGSSIHTVRTMDGALVGSNETTGAKSLAACAAMTATARLGVVCSWTGGGFAPFSMGENIQQLGGSGMSPSIEHCALKTAVIEAGRLCSWDGQAIRIYSIASGKSDDELGTFTSYAVCANVLRAVATDSGRAEFVGALRGARTAAVNPDDDRSSTAGRGGDEASGFNLAGGGWTWTECNDAQRGYHLVARDGQGLICRDKIDTLYSWGPSVKINWLKGQPWSGRLERDGRAAPVFTTQSAYATYGYGEYAIRFKVRDSANWRFFDNVNAYDVCDQVSASEVDDTIAVRYWHIGDLTGVDYILCGLGPIHSWSYGSRAHYQEMTRETAWIASNNIRNYELYVKEDGSDVIPRNLDHHEFNNNVWQANLNRHLGLAPGSIFFNPSVSQDTSEHFRTRWANYINPNGGGGGVNPVVDGGVLDGGNGRDDDVLAPRDFVGSKFRDGGGRTLWLNPGRVCSAKPKSRDPVDCTWEFRNGGTIVVTLSDGKIWYYWAKTKDSICFTGDGAPGATCQGVMTRY